MSNFPFAWWDKTLTIYNKSIDPTNQRVSWNRTVLKNCFWKYTSEIYIVGHSGLTSRGVILETNEVICRIPQDKRYVSAKAWKSLTDKSNKFTLAYGDILVLGDVEDVIDDYTSGQRSTDIITKYKALDGCIQVESWVDNVQTGVGLGHYKVIGK